MTTVRVPEFRPSPGCPSCGGMTARALHLVDVENLAGGPARVDRWFVPSLEAYLAVAGLGRLDQVIVAADITL